MLGTELGDLPQIVVTRGRRHHQCLRIGLAELERLIDVGETPLARRRFANAHSLELLLAIVHIPAVLVATAAVHVALHMLKEVVSEEILAIKQI